MLHKKQRIVCRLFALMAAGCATSPSDIERFPGALSVPYRLSPTGLFIVDVAVNGSEPRPFFIDSGASRSAVYEQHLGLFGLSLTDRTTLVRGLVTTGERPTIGNVELAVGELTLPERSVVSLQSSPVAKDAVGVLGADTFGDFAILFNVDTNMATFVPSADLSARSFVGWRRTALFEGIEGYANRGLHFTDLRVGDERHLALLDTGTDTTIVNWALASEDRGMRRRRLRMREQWELQGAIGRFSPRVAANLEGVVLGRNYWPNVEVIVMDLDTLSTVAPTDAPMMIAGADLFNQRTVAFDFGNNAIYLMPKPDDPKAPRQGPIYVVGSVSALEQNLGTTRN